MKTTQYIRRASLLICGILLSGCDDFVAVDQPNSQLTSNAVFESATTANAAMADVYSQMRENGFASGLSFGLSVTMGVYADELVSFQNGPFTTAPFYNNTLLASDDFVAQLWNGSYNQIYACNAIIEGVAQAQSLPEADRQRLHGEALFARAFVYLHLVNTYGDVPFITTTDYVANSTVSRTASQTVYQNVISDLEMATELLPEADLSGNRTRPVKAAAQALLARAYLYHGDYVEAANTASAVLNEGQYSLEANLDEVFLVGSPETVWQIASGGQGSNTNEGSTFIFYAGPPAVVSLTDDIVAGFETGDLRKEFWVKEVSDGSTSWYHPYKYKLDTPTGSSMEYSIQLRVAELYLIRAEARARQGELSAAKDDLAIIRSRAGLPVSAATSQQELLEAILEERRYELFTEQGHRFFDLRRFGKLDEVLGIKPGWNVTDNLWPLPQTELLANPFLSPQNPGY